MNQNITVQSHICEFPCLHSKNVSIENITWTRDKGSRSNAVLKAEAGYLATYFNSNTRLVQSTMVREASFPGADLRSIYSHIWEESITANRKYHTHRIVIIYIGGICSPTTQRRGRGRGEIACSSTEKIATIKAVYDDIWQFWNDGGYYLMTTTIYPVSL